MARATESEFKRPTDSDYWCRPWSSILFAGDVFEAIPFAVPETEIYVLEGYAQDQHYFGEVGYAYGLLISPTCDMYESVEPEVLAHPYRVLVPVLPLSRVVEETRAVERSVGLLRGRDSLTAYMYLPELPGHFEESVACLFRPTVVTERFLAEPPRRVAQLKPEARRHLKVKLAGYWGRAKVEADALPLHERDEDAASSRTHPPSRFDSAEALNR